MLKNLFTRNFGIHVARLAALSLSLAVPVESFAKEVHLEWKKIKGAQEYEIRVEDQAGTPVATQKHEDPEWKGNLNPGFYTYQIRGYDWMKRPGKWSTPKALAVMPEQKTEAAFPKDGAKIPTYLKTVQLPLKWKPLPGTNKYRVELRRGKDLVFQTTTDRAEVMPPKLIPGDYEWTITPVIQPTAGRVPASLQSKVYEAKTKVTADFRIEQKTLKAPSPIEPSGAQRPPAENKLLIAWDKVEDATEYEIEVYRHPAADRAPASVIYKSVLKKNSVVLNLAADGSYSWKVRAIASIGPSKEDLAISPQSTTEFKIDRNAMFMSGSGYLALSSMLAPYTYVTDGNGAISARARSVAVTGRVSAEYWPWNRFGVSAGFEDTIFRLNGVNYDRNVFEFHAKYRLKLDESRYGWFLAPKLGFESRSYLHLLVYSGQSTLSSRGTGAIGPSIGVDIRRQFNDRWSVGAKIAYFLPLALTGVDPSYSMTSDQSFRNFSAGVQALYWLNPKWSIAAGGYFDMRSLSYTKPGDTKKELISMDAMYFFGSLIWTFGKN